MSEATTTDPLLSHDFKSLQSVEFDTEFNRYVTRIDREVPHGSSLPSASASVLRPVIKNERNTTKSRLSYGIPGSSVSVPEKTFQAKVPERFVCAASKASSQALASASVTPAFKTLSDRIVPIDAYNAQRVTETVADFTSLTSVETDDDGVLITVAESVVAKGTAVPANTSTTKYSQIDLDCQHALLRAVTAGLTWTRTYYKTIDFRFPGLLSTPDDNDLDAFFIPQQRRTVFKSNFTVRPAFTARVHAKVVETVSAEPTAYGSLTALFNPIPQDIVYDGTLFSVNVRDVLNDAFNLTATTNSEDAYWGYAVESLDVPASTMSLATYLGYITPSPVWACIGDDTIPWKHGFYKRVQTYIYPQ